MIISYECQYRSRRLSVSVLVAENLNNIMLYLSNMKLEICNIKLEINNEV